MIIILLLTGDCFNKRLFDKVNKILIEGKRMAKAKNVEDFIARQRAGIAQNPECGTSHYNLAVGLMGQKRYDEAEKELHEALECSPSLAEAYVLLGGICLQRGDLDGCLKYNKMAVKTRPGFSEGYGNIGFVELQRGNVDEAIKNLERATAFNFRFVQAFANLGNAYLMKGRLEESIENNLKAVKLQPNFAPAHNNLAIAYLEKQDYNRAAEHRDKAVELGYEVAAEIQTEIDQHRKKDIYP
jgi:tetratricopeptide (TPR) repeat protein